MKLPLKSPESAAGGRSFPRNLCTQVGNDDDDDDDDSDSDSNNNNNNNNTYNKTNYMH